MPGCTKKDHSCPLGMQKDKTLPCKGFKNLLLPQHGKSSHLSKRMLTSAKWERKQIIGILVERRRDAATINKLNKQEFSNKACVKNKTYEYASLLLPSPLKKNLPSPLQLFLPSDLLRTSQGLFARRVSLELLWRVGTIKNFKRTLCSEGPHSWFHALL